MEKQLYTSEWNDKSDRGDSKTVVILLHGMDCSPKTLAPLIDRMKQDEPSPSIYCPKLPFEWQRCLNMKDLSKEVTRKIAEIESTREITSIVLSGHSAGGVLAQSVYLTIQSNEEFKELRIKLEEIDFRIVLIAPLTRGWAINHHLPLVQKISWTLGLWLVPILRLYELFKYIFLNSTKEDFWVMQLQRSSPFLVWLRLTWLKIEGKKPDENKVKVFILLGSIDELISWKDMIDVVHGVDNVVHLQVPFSDHVTIIDFKEQGYGEQRARLFSAALWKTVNDARQLKEFIQPWDDKPVSSDLSVKRMVFVIHGIRDEGHWTQKIASLAKNNYRSAQLEREQIKVETSSYGYFSMLEFLMRRARYEKMRWLMDEYVEAKRRYPEADFSFIGHSNGTYLLAQSLKEYEDVKFDRIAFAGSVVSSNFDWDLLKERGQVQYVLNFMASKDWVVSCLPRLADILPLSWILGPNLGGASVVPFNEVENVVWSTEKYVEGGHGAAIQEINWPALAQFAVADQNPPPLPVYDSENGPTYVDQAKWWYRPNIGKLTTPMTFTVAIGLVCYLGYLAWMLPKWFWGVPLVICFVIVPVVALIMHFSRGRTIRIRKTSQKLANLFVLAGLAIALLLILSGPWTASGLLTISNATQGVRTASVLLFGFLLHRILTRF